jgi:hypothetical protein
VCQLEGELKLEMGHWNELYNRCRDLLDRMLIFDHWKEVCIFDVVSKKLLNHLNEEFEKTSFNGSHQKDERH